MHNYSHIFFLVLTFLIPIRLPANDYRWLEKSPHPQDLHFTEQQKEFLRKVDPDLFRLTPVVHSNDEAFGQADGLGYAVGGYDGSAIFISFYARAFHFGGPGGKEGKYPPGSSRCTIVRSVDDGLTWDAPFKADREIGLETSKIGWGNSIIAEPAKTLAISTAGIFKTVDSGISWTRFPTALAQDGMLNSSVSESKYHLGPSAFRHPVGGLMTFAQAKSEEDGSGSFYILHSIDEGESWTATVVKTGNNAVIPVEPSAVLYGEQDRIFLFTRNGKNGQASSPSTLFIDVIAPGKYSVSHAGVTNARVDGHQDTHDIIYNEKTDCFESVVVNRGSKDNHYNIMELSLYSIPRVEAESGSHHWNYLGHLILPIDGAYGKGVSEGAHPGGSFIKGNYHYIPFHRGESYATHSSIYLIRRSLDTKALQQVLPKLGSHITEKPK